MSFYKSFMSFSPWLLLLQSSLQRVIFPICRCKLRTDAKVRDLYRIGRTLGTGGERLTCERWSLTQTFVIGCTVICCRFTT